MAITDKRKDTMMEYAKKNLKRIPLDVQKEHYERIKAHAAARGESVNGFIKQSISEAMARDYAEESQKTAGQYAGGRVFLPFETLEAAQQAAKAAGEGLQDFVQRAISETAEREKRHV